MPEPIDPSCITDHALIRWLERVAGMDMEYFRAHVADRCADLLRSGASGGWIDEHWTVIKHGQVITFSPTKPNKKPKGLR